jgi:alkanesulfonate monooxygenase SsuD/methylene tetrahydromethanopterin reductase-like flavin-dependent oxidoreductase (luciferase family)
MQSEYEQAGLDFDAGRFRVERLAEAVTLIKGLLSGEQVALAGRHYRATGHTIFPLPVQRPHPPILIGGNGRSLLTLAAREADIVGFSGITFRRVARSRTFQDGECLRSTSECSSSATSPASDMHGSN